MGSLILVRHAVAVGDGDEDPGLSPEGRVQAAALADRLNLEGITELWHSPRTRAQETALSVARTTTVPARCTDLLDDRTPVPSAHRWGDYPSSRWTWLRSVPPDERDEDGAALTAAWMQFAIDPASVTEISFDRDNATIRRLNDCHHLKT